MDNGSEGTGGASGSNAGGAGPQTQGQQQQAQAGAGTGGGAQGGQTPIESLPGDVQEYIKSLRNEAATYRTQHKTVADELTKLKTSGLSEAEQLKQRLENLEKQNGELSAKAIRADKTAALQSAGATKTDLLLSAIADDLIGKPEELKARIKELKSEYPELFPGSGSRAAGSPGAAQAGAGAGTGGRSATGGAAGAPVDMNERLRQEWRNKRGGGGEPFAVPRQ